MFGVGALIKAAKGGVQAYRLPELISEAERELATPLLNHYTDAQRFEIASRLLEAALFHQLTTTPDQADHIKANYLSRLRQEFNMARSTLSQQPAMRDEVASLGIALREVALTLDKNIEGFEAQGAKAIEQVRADQRTVVASARKEISLVVESQRREGATATAAQWQQFEQVIGEMKGTANRELRAALAQQGDLIEQSVSAVAKRQMGVVDGVRIDQLRLRREMEEGSHAASAQLKTLAINLAEVDARVGDQSRALDTQRGEHATLARAVAAAKATVAAQLSALSTEQAAKVAEVRSIASQGRMIAIVGVVIAVLGTVTSIVVSALMFLR